MNPELRAVLTEAQQSVIRERVSMALHAAESSCLEQGQVPGYSAMAEAAVTAREDLLQLASIADAYGYLLLETTQKRRDFVCREARRWVTGEEA
ncbi:hypothetical protein SEA_MAHAVRAT_78 [Mycobacterium phage Mahavrat]|uniref:Uncharacterized protein n=1 Tax=Mycobacterium phage Mahavrat TaxID=2591129 RepID=A0A515MLB8_9CAUD|nr:hypothetical protein I5H59_gp78 [Mycobacterium phage Mahavrat]QDM57462.1 hypothetical protein SEA_MAHAVRAT_78 [Mycobacterium phage Mahavrat]